MTDLDLIAALREDAEWARANEWETPITLGDHLTAAAERIEALKNETEHLREATKMVGEDANVPTNADHIRAMSDFELMPYMIGLRRSMLTISRKCSMNFLPPMLPRCGMENGSITANRISRYVLRAALSGI